MFFKNISNTTVIFFIILLCNMPTRINGMDSLMKFGNWLINTIQTEDNQAEKNIFYYYDESPITERSFNKLREIVCKIDFDKSSLTVTNEASKKLSKSLYPIWKEQFLKDHAETSLETAIALAKMAKYYVITERLQKTTPTIEDDIIALLTQTEQLSKPAITGYRAIIQYDDITAEFTDGMAVLLYDIDLLQRSSCHIRAKGFKNW